MNQNTIHKLLTEAPGAVYSSMVKQLSPGQLPDFGHWVYLVQSQGNYNPLAVKLKTYTRIQWEGSKLHIIATVHTPVVCTAHQASFYLQREYFREFILPKKIWITPLPDQMFTGIYSRVIPLKVNMSGDKTAVCIEQEESKVNFVTEI